MAVKLECVNISSKDPERLARFYETIGVRVSVQDPNYDGWQLRNADGEPYVCVWDEHKWGRSTAGYITIVLKAEDLQKTYEEIKSRGVSIDPPRRADWGGQELVLKDPDGNVVMIL
ncbi:MAG: VOC family protein [Bacillota bacterium]|jgi:predicted enzyme related to lactoylglutathione lyase